MKRITKLFTALAFAVGLTTAASAYTSSRVISMNFGNQGAAPDSAGIVAVSAAAWNNVTAKANTRTDLKTWNGTEATTLSPNWSITWSAGDVWSSSDTDIILKGYLDDKDAVADQATATFNSIPFEYYDIYIYKAADSSTDFSPVTLTQGDVTTSYTCGSSGIAMVGTGRWGQTQQKTCKMGTNVICIQGVSGSSVTVKGGVRNSGRGCIAAIQIVETEKPIPPVEYGLELSESAAWQSAGWDPSLPETGMTEKDTATVTATGEPTLTLDGTITCGKLVIKSGEGDMLTFKKAEGANTSFGTVDVSEATDGTTWDSTEGFTACNALLNAARTGNYKFYFLGEGENGVTLDYGTAQNNYTFNGHYIFDGGTHTFQNCSESAGLNFGANATEDNPTFWVKNGATLNFKSRNPCGWSATANTDGIVRIGEDSKVKISNSASGSWFWAQRFYFEPGSELEIAVEADKMALDGGVVTDKEQLYMPASEDGVATISASGGGQLRLARDVPGVAAFVGAGSTLDVTAPLVSQLNKDGKTYSTTLAKTGAGTLKLSGDVSGFGAPIQVKAGTLEAASATALGAGATIAVDAGATLKITADEDREFAKTVSGSGAVVKAGAGTLTATAGAFDDNTVSITGGKINFTATGAQAKEGVALCKADEDISENVIVVNEEGKELSGEFTFEDNTLSFKVNCADVSYTLEIDTDWSDVADSLGWINSPESTLTVTCTMSEAVLRFDQEIIAKSITFVSEDGNDAIIPDGSFQYMQIASYDFTEAKGGVTISFQDLAPGELRLVTGVPIAGFANVRAEEDSVPEGYGFYADATHIWLCKEVDITRMNPVTGDEVTFTYAFFGTTDGDWEKCANWRQCENDLFTPYTNSVVAPALRGGSLQPVLFDGDQMDDIEPEEGYKCVTADGDPTVDGWNGQYGFYNGVKVTAGELYGITSGGVQLNWYVDEYSKFIIAKGPSTNYGSKRTLNFWVAGEDGVEFVQKYTVDATFNYAMAGYGSVKFDGGIAGATHNLTNGTLKVEGVGFTGGTLNVLGVAALVTPALTATVNIAEDATLTLTSSADGDLTIGGNWTNNGTLEVVAGTVVFKPGVTPGSYTTAGEGKVIIGQLVTINDCGKIAVTGATADDVRLFDVGGNPVAVTKVEGGYAYYDWDVTGKNCWWDYEFNGNLDGVGTDTQTLSEEGTTPYYNEDNTALRVGYGTPYRGASYPEEFTAVIYGKMVNNATHIEIGFGSTYAGTAKGVVIACGDPTKNEVKLLVTSGYGVVETIPMSVTDPYDTDHLYAFTCQTINDGGTDKTKVSLYLDGKFLQAYTFDSKVTLGTGFQVGSIHGGSLAGYTKATTANTHADLDFLRVYQTVLTAEAMEKYAGLYPYTSKGGASERTFDDSLDQTWAAYGIKPWTVTPFEEEAFPTNCALAGSQVTVSASADAEVTMNLDATTTYESLAIGEGSAIVFKAGEDAVEPTITGGTTIKTDVMVDYNAIKFGTVEVASGKTLTFDFTDFPWTNYFANATIPFTGATSGEGTITATGLVTGDRTATFEKNASTDQYELKITVDTTIPFVCYLTEDDVRWTWGSTGSQEVDEATVDAYPAIPICLFGTSILEKSLANNRSYSIYSGLFQAKDAANKHFDVLVKGPGTFDFHGSADGYANIVLDGGKLSNYGNDMGTGSRQIDGITLTADSEIEGTGNFGMISSQSGANTLDLGGNILRKLGTNTFWLCNTTVTNGEFRVVKGAVKAVTNPVTFTDDAVLNLSSDEATFDVASALSIGAIEAHGATINNTGTISDFTLTGRATLTGNGNWGTNTLAEAAVAIVGEKRDFTFAGAGTVDVTLTDAEYEGELPITLFATNGVAATKVGNVTYGGVDITEKCTIVGNQITAIEKFQPIDPSQEDVIECKDADAATVLAAAITLDPASYVKAPAAVTDPADIAAYQALFCGRALGNYVYIELTDKAIEDLQAEVDATTVTESVAASLIEPSATSVTIQALTPGLYYWVEGSETPDFEDLVQGSAGMATASGISLELVKPETIGTSGKQFYKIAVGTMDPNPEAEAEIFRPSGVSNADAMGSNL